MCELITATANLPMLSAFWRDLAHRLRSPDFGRRPRPSRDFVTDEVTDWSPRTLTSELRRAKSDDRLSLRTLTTSAGNLSNNSTFPPLARLAFGGCTLNSALAFLLYLPLFTYRFSPLPYSRFFYLDNLSPDFIETMAISCPLRLHLVQRSEASNCVICVLLTQIQ